MGGRRGDLPGLDAPALSYFHRRALRSAIERTAILEIAEQNLGRPRDEPPGQLDVTVVFVDLSGFTALTEAMGDLKTAEVLDRFSGFVRQAVTAFGGQVVKQIGDAFLLVFRDPSTRSPARSTSRRERRPRRRSPPCVRACTTGRCSTERVTTSGRP